MSFIIKCPKCSFTYKVDKTEQKIITCQESGCGASYHQDFEKIRMFDFVYEAVKRCKGER